MAKAICGDLVADAALLEQAKAIAENQLLLRRVRMEKLRLIENFGDRLATSCAESKSTYLPCEESEASSMPLAARIEYEAMERAMPELDRLRRYERRAYSRQRKAISLFIALMVTNELRAPG